MRWFVSIIVSLCLASLDASFVEAQTSKKTLYQTPNAAFDAAQTAVKKENWPVFCNALTDQSISTLSGMMVVLGGAVKKALKDPNIPPQFRATFEQKVKPLMDVLKKHKIPETALADAGASAAKLKDLEPAELRRRLTAFSKTVPNRAGFLADFLAAIRRQKGDKGPSSFKGKLTSVKVSGNTASGIVIRSDHKEPVTFRKVGDGWLIDISDQMLGRMVSGKKR